MVEIDSSRYDFKTPEKYAYRSKKGLSEGVIREISKMKEEPEWMLKNRLEGLKHFKETPLPKWGPDLSKLNFDDLFYYVKPSGSVEEKWDKVPDEIKDTFDKLGIPEAERKFLAGSTAQFESESVYHHLKKQWEEKGIIFTDMDTALREHPEIVEKYFGTVVPIDDNKFASLNTASWSGGSFVYVPKNTKCEIPLQAYFRINTEKLGQFERTMIIVDEGASVSYIEGCFTAGTKIHIQGKTKNIEEIRIGEQVLTHAGRYMQVKHIQSRPYSGPLYNITIYGNPNEVIEATQEHPFYCVSRERKNERNSSWNPKWVDAKNLKVKDYLALPIRKEKTILESVEIEVPYGLKKRNTTKMVRIPSTKSFFRLAGYFISEGSISSGAYLNFSFATNENKYIDDVKRLIKRVFGIEKIAEHVHKTNNGISLVVSSVALCRAFESMFGHGSHNKKIPTWMMEESLEKQKQLIIGMFLGDGNYYNKKTPSKGWLKESFRLSTTSVTLAKQSRDLLLRQGIAAFLNARDRSKEGRKTMFTIGVTGEYMIELGKMFGIKVPATLNGKKRATMFHIDDNFLYMPIKKIEKREVKDIPVFNFSVEDDESYVANNVAAHNCSAPVYTTASLHAAVVEIIAMKNAKVRYTTIQNWSNNVYNLVTKRSVAHENSVVEWLDGNMGSAVTVKYPSVILKGEGARAEFMSVAYAGKGQVQDTGAKAIHLAPNTSSKITQKSVCKDGGRSSYRGLVHIAKGAQNVKSFVQCDAYLLDELSRSDTYPTIKSEEKKSTVAHEARVGKIGTDKLFYLMSRGIPEKDALAMIVLGFMESFTRELPMEYAVELNRLIQLQLEGAVG